MKYFLTLLTGLVLGAAVALTMLTYNPLTQNTGSPPSDGDTLLTYASPVTGQPMFTHGGQSRLPTNPLGVAELWEATLTKSALGIIILRAPDGTPAAIASRISYPSEDTDFLRRGAILNDEWLVSVPGQGSLFVDAQSNWWPLLRDALIPVWYLGRPWRGPAVYEPTVGPGARGDAVVRGATGAFAGRSGTAAERYQVEAFDEVVGPRKVYSELYWRFAVPVADIPSE